MSVIEKSESLSLVAGSGLPRRRALAQLGLAKSTYYRWLKRQALGRLQDRKGGSLIPWNKLRPKEEEKIFALARALPELSARELALRIIDIDGLYISESTVFRALKREGLIKPAEIVGFKAGREYHRKTKKANELWATDCSHIKVIDWGWYYLVTVMDDYSRFILAWELKSDMASNSLIDVVQKAIDATGMTDVSVEDRTMLLSDNGPGYISRQFGDYLRLVGIRHIMASPFHPQTIEKIIGWQRKERLCPICSRQIPKGRRVYCSSSCYQEGQKFIYKDAKAKERRLNSIKKSIQKRRLLELAQDIARGQREPDLVLVE